MDEPRYISRIVNLTIQDYLTIRRLAEEEGLGQKGFSNALRLIIQDWLAFTNQTPPTVPERTKPKIPTNPPRPRFTVPPLPPSKPKPTK